MTAIPRPAGARGLADHGWLLSYHSFSFADYADPAHMGFRALRVINDDVIRPGGGFDTHGHRDMEIITYVVEGALAHRDSTGSSGVLARGDVQYMSAGTGVRHSEVNASKTQDVRLLQIWILPPRRGLPPSYTQRTVADAAKRDTLALIAAPDGPLSTHQDVRLYASLLGAGATVRHVLTPGRGAWVQVVTGAIAVNGIAMAEGDGLALEDEPEIHITSDGGAEFLLFDLV